MLLQVSGRERTKIKIGRSTLSLSSDQIITYLSNNIDDYNDSDDLIRNRSIRCSAAFVFREHAYTQRTIVFIFFLSTGQTMKKSNFCAGETCRPSSLLRIIDHAFKLNSIKQLVSTTLNFVNPYSHIRCVYTDYVLTRPFFISFYKPPSTL